MSSYKKKRKFNEPTKVCGLQVPISKYEYYKKIFYALVEGRLNVSDGVLTGNIGNSNIEDTEEYQNLETIIEDRDQEIKDLNDIIHELENDTNIENSLKNNLVHTHISGETKLLCLNVPKDLWEDYAEDFKYIVEHEANGKTVVYETDHGEK